MEMFERPIAITDIETSGLDPIGHEILEMGLILIKQPELEVLESWSTKIKPENIETATKEALAVNGYKPEDWEKAVPLKMAMSVYRKKTKNAIFLSHNVCFDWSFIYEAFAKTELESMMDYHRLDLFSLAWAKRHKMQGVIKFNLVELCKYFNIEKEPDPHKAIHGAEKALEVLRCLEKL